MSSTQAGASGDAPKQSGLVRLIKMASINATQSIAMPDLTLTLESWDQLKQMRRPEAYSLTQLVGLSDTELKREFLHCATRMYMMRKGWPAHADYQRFTADPQVQTKLDTVSHFCAFCASNASLHLPLCNPLSRSMAIHGVIPKDSSSALKLTRAFICTGFQRAL